jgi:hypothetical protein
MNENSPRQICLPNYEIVKSLNQVSATCFGNPDSANPLELIVLGNMEGELHIYIGVKKSSEKLVDPWRQTKLGSSIACLLVTIENILFALCHDGSLTVFNL